MQLTMTAKGVMTMTIGEYVKVYRTEHSLSQRQFASLCGVSNGYISMLETGVNTSNGQPIVPTLQTMRKISNAMGRTIHQVLSEVDDVVLDIGAEDEKSPGAEAPELTPEELALLTAFRSLPPEDRAFVLRQLSALSRQTKAPAAPAE
jgi:transcriptional regulator with XRE-family HTH domain